MRKINFIQLAATALLMAGMVSCEVKETETETKTASVGIPPSSIEDVIDIFELKYGEVKELRRNGQVFKFSIVDIEDDLVDCTFPDTIFATAYWQPPDNRIHVFLRITGQNETRQKITSPKCAAHYYLNDGSDITKQWNMLESLLSRYTGTPNYPDVFFTFYGTGASFGNNSMNMYLTQAYPRKYELGYTPDKSMYKFIFVVTNNQKTK